MTFQTAHDSAIKLLETMDINDLVCWNRKFFNAEFFENYIKFEGDFESTFTQLGLDGITLDTEKKRQRIVFAIFTTFSYIVSHLEILNKFLRIVTCQKPKLQFDENTTLPYMLDMICGKIGYNKKETKSIRDIFYTDFRNAISHHDYLISEEIMTIFPADIKKKKTIDLDGLAQINDNVKGLLAGFKDFAGDQIMKKKFKR